MKSPKKSDIENKMLEELNSFMKEFNLDEISFGVRGNHSLKRTKGKKAKPIIKTKKKRHTR